jgi:hypothetical protein
LEDGSLKLLSELKAGDRVLAADPTTGALVYTTFTQNTHAVKEGLASFIALTTAHATLKLSPGHLLYRAVKQQQQQTEGDRRGAGSFGQLARHMSNLVFPAALDGLEVEVVAARMVEEGDILFVAESMLPMGAELAHSSNSTDGNERSASTVISMGVDLGGARSYPKSDFKAQTVSKVSRVHEVGYYSPTPTPLLLWWMGF